MSEGKLPVLATALDAWRTLFGNFVAFLVLACFFSVLSFSSLASCICLSFSFALTVSVLVFPDLFPQDVNEKIKIAHTNVVYNPFVIMFFRD